MCRLIATSCISFALLALAGCERAQTRLDREVDRLCANEGGTQIYETITLPKDSFGPNGEVFPQYRGLPLSDGRFGPDYYFSVDERVLISGDPTLRKSVSAIVRRSDGKILGARVNFSRHGGDMAGPWHDSARSCLDVLPMDKGLELLVFVQPKESQ